MMKLPGIQSIAAYKKSGSGRAILILRNPEGQPFQRGRIAVGRKRKFAHGVNVSGAEIQRLRHLKPAKLLLI